MNLLLGANKGEILNLMNPLNTAGGNTDLRSVNRAHETGKKLEKCPLLMVGLNAKAPRAAAHAEHSLLTHLIQITAEPVGPVRN